MNQPAKIRRFLFSCSKSHRRALVAAFGLIGFLAPFLFAYLNGFPIPTVHDEFGYLFAADTFAAGRMTNPTPVSPESFEAPHLLIEPTFASKYPPIQGLFLAVGQVVFGNPIFGVWLSCGLAAMSLFWMLSAWTRPPWAVFGTCLMILLLGIDHYWAQSYWGGMAAAAGGALFFGGFRRLFDKITIGATLLMVLGGIILVNSRPFEGTVTMIPSMLILLVWLLRDKSASLALKLSRIILPAALLTGLALSMMAFYNYRITGDPLRFAYTEHQSQYFSTPLFVFQTPADRPLRGNARLRALYDYLDFPVSLRNMENFGIPVYREFGPVYAIFYLLIYLPYGFLGPALALGLFVTLPFFAGNRWTRVILSTIVFTMLCMSIVPFWENLHYAAPLTVCFYLLIAEACRFFAAVCKRNRRLKTTAPVLLFVILLSGFYLWNESNTERLSAGQFVFPDLDRPLKLIAQSKTTHFKAAIENHLGNRPENYLALVSHETGYDLTDDIVFNKADLDSAKLIWALDLGPEKNAPLLEFYKDRKILFISIGGGEIRIDPLPRKQSNEP